MEELIEQLRTCCAGKTVEEITADLESLPNIPVDKIPALSAWLASLNDA